MVQNHEKVKLEKRKEAEMKLRNIKKIVAISTLCVMGSTVLSGCGKDPYKKVDYEVKDYVKLGKYTDLSVEEKITKVTDKDVQGAIDAIVEEKTTYSEITDRYAKNTDRLTIDFIRTEKGKESEEQQTKTFELGEGDMGEDFEKQMVNMKLDGTKTFTVKEEVPEESEEEDDSSTTSKMKEVDVTYAVTVKKIEEKKVPEVTDAFIKENTDSDTVEAFKKTTREEMEASNAESAKTTAENELLQMVVDSSSVSGAPTFLFNINYNSIAQNYATMASYYGMDLEQYLSMFGSNLDKVKLQAVASTQEYLVVEALLKELNMEVTDDEYDKRLPELVEEYNFKSAEEMLKEVTKDQILMTMRREKAIDYLYENSKVTQKTVEPETDAE